MESIFNQFSINFLVFLWSFIHFNPSFKDLRMLFASDDILSFRSNHIPLRFLPVIPVSFCYTRPGRAHFNRPTRIVPEETIDMVVGHESFPARLTPESLPRVSWVRDRRQLWSRGHGVAWPTLLPSLLLVVPVSPSVIGGPGRGLRRKFEGPLQERNQVFFL